MKTLYILLATSSIVHAQDIKPMPVSPRLHYNQDNQGLVSNDIVITIASTSTPNENKVVDLANVPQRPINLLEIMFYKRGFPV